MAAKTDDAGRAKSATKKYDPQFLDSAEFDEMKISRTWLVEGVLIKGQPGVIGGPQKTLKTSLAVDMAVSLGLGKPFLERFAVPRARRVAVISGESGVSTLQDLARRVARARGGSLGRGCRVSWSTNLPRLGCAEDLDALEESLRDQKVSVVFIDPLYLCLLAGTSNLSAANLYDVGPLLRRAGEACLRAGATPVFLHHSNKSSAGQGRKGGVPTLADLAFVGVAEYVRQWLLLARRESFRPGTGTHRLVMAAGGSAGHSGCWNLDVEERASVPGVGRGRWRTAVSDYDFGEAG